MDFTITHTISTLQILTSCTSIKLNTIYLLLYLLTVSLMRLQSFRFLFHSFEKKKRWHNVRDASNFVLRIFAFNFYFLLLLLWLFARSERIILQRLCMCVLYMLKRREECSFLFSDLVPLTYVIAESDFTSIT